MPIEGYTYLTSKEEIVRVFSADGTLNHLEDVPLPEDVIDEICVRATEKVLLYLRSNHSIEDLETNYWVREQATYIGCYLLSIRRGNPSLYSDVYQMALDDLQLVRAGLLDAGIPSVARPVLQTPGTDNRYYRTQRLNPRQSTRTLPKQNERLPWYGWWD